MQENKENAATAVNGIRGTCPSTTTSTSGRLPDKKKAQVPIATTPSEQPRSQVRQKSL